MHVALVLLSVMMAEESIVGEANQSGTEALGDRPDARIALVRDTNTVFEMTPFESLDEWERYAEGLRRRLLVSCGLWPMPERTPLHPQVTGLVEHDDYVIENVSLEARPGFYVTGNLYRPPGDGPFPAIACPHGHWGEGRLENGEMGSVAARCITFARMGVVAFSYDMVGYNDSCQFPRDWGHNSGSVPIEERRRQALWAIHPFAMQLWSSIRVIDFLEGLPYVDPERIGCTGASGGGTQTFALCAIEPRVKVAAPVNMISHTMQGGCICENAPIIRFNASNMEIGALMAPRPLLLVSATGDWTKDTPSVEYPAIRGIYRFYGAEDRVDTHQEDAGHNYNQASRERVYRFFGKWLLNQEEPYRDFTEPAYEMEPVETLRVFPEEKLPEGARTHEDIMSDMIAEARSKWNAVLPASPDEVEAFRAKYGAALADVLGASVPPPEAIECVDEGRDERDGYSVARLVIGRKGAGDVVHGKLYAPDGDVTGAALVVHGQGVGALEDGPGNPGPLCCALLDAGKAVLAIDAFLVCGNQEREYGAYPDTFLPTDTAYRVQDVLTALAHLRSRTGLAPGLIGLAGAGPWCLFAAALDGNIAAVVADMDGFDTEDDAAWVARCYVPCIRSLGDVATAAALISPRPLWVVNTADSFDPAAVARAFPPGVLHVTRDPLSAGDIAAALE